MHRVLDNGTVQVGNDQEKAQSKRNSHSKVDKNIFTWASYRNEKSSATVQNCFKTKPLAENRNEPHHEKTNILHFACATTKAQISCAVIIAQLTSAFVFAT